MTQYSRANAKKMDERDDIDGVQEIDSGKATIHQYIDNYGDRGVWIIGLTDVDDVYKEAFINSIRALSMLLTKVTLSDARRKNVKEAVAVALSTLERLLPLWWATANNHFLGHEPDKFGQLGNYYFANMLVEETMHRLLRTLVQNVTRDPLTSLQVNYNQFLQSRHSAGSRDRKMRKTLVPATQKVVLDPQKRCRDCKKKPKKLVDDGYAGVFDQLLIRAHISESESERVSNKVYEYRQILLDGQEIRPVRYHLKDAAFDNSYFLSEYKDGGGRKLLGYGRVHRLFTFQGKTYFEADWYSIYSESPKNPKTGLVRVVRDHHWDTARVELVKNIHPVEVAFVPADPFKDERLPRGVMEVLLQRGHTIDTSNDDPGSWKLVIV